MTAGACDAMSHITQPRHFAIITQGCAGAKVVHPKLHVRGHAQVQTSDHLKSAQERHKEFTTRSIGDNHSKRGAIVCHLPAAEAAACAATCRLHVSTAHSSCHAWHAVAQPAHLTRHHHDPSRVLAVVHHVNRAPAYRSHTCIVRCKAITHHPPTLCMHSQGSMRL